MSADRLADIPARERLIVALDFNNKEAALKLVDQLGGVVSFFKVGYELFLSEGWDLIQRLSERNLKVFLDLKMDDVEETITKAVRHVATRPVEFLTVFGSGATAEAAKAGKQDSNLKILQITVLTSLGETDLSDLMLVGADQKRFKFKSVSEYVEYRAGRSLKHGCDGLIASGQNAKRLREKLGSGFILVCPGIRPGDDSTDDHKRASTPYQAIADGADYIVVGRPIRNAPNPKTKAEGIIAEIEKALQDRA